MLCNRLLVMMMLVLNSMMVMMGWLMMNAHRSSHRFGIFTSTLKSTVHGIAACYKESKRCQQHGRYKRRYKAFHDFSPRF